MRRSRLSLLAVPIAAATVGVVMAMTMNTASAAVTFDPATGLGFVGKGDVQTAFTWNNKQLQDNATGVAFSYNATTTYDAVCTWTTGEGTRGEKTHNVTHNTSTVVDSAVAYDARTHKQIDGFNLNGFGATTSTGEVPVVGAPCPGNAGTEGTWSSVLQTGSSGGLYATSGGNAVLLQ